MMYGHNTEYSVVHDAETQNSRDHGEHAVHRMPCIFDEQLLRRLFFHVEIQVLAEHRHACPSLMQPDPGSKSVMPRSQHAEQQPRQNNTSQHVCFQSGGITLALHRR